MNNRVDHVHHELNREITAIGGHYAFLKESTMSYGEKIVLYYVGCAVLDSTCCGVGGVCFARVSGFVCDLKYRSDDAGASISRIEPITDPTSQNHIRQVLQDSESVTQVDFS
jgi:hypothetical protein